MSLTLLEQWSGFWFYVALKEEPDMWKCFETEHTVFHPYPRRLDKITVCRGYYKGSTFFSVILRPCVLVQQGVQPTTYHSADQQVRLPTKLTRRWFSVTLRLKCLRWLNTVLAVSVYVICQIMATERLQLTSWNLAIEKYTDERSWLTDKMWRLWSCHGNMNDWIQP